MVHWIEVQADSSTQASRCITIITKGIPYQTKIRKVTLLPSTPTLTDNNQQFTFLKAMAYLPDHTASNLIPQIYNITNNRCLENMEYTLNYLKIMEQDHSKMQNLINWKDFYAKNQK